MQGVRIGVLTTLSDTASRDDEVATLFAKSLDDLRVAGAEIVPGVELPIIKSAQAKLWRNTFRHDLNEYLKSVGESAPYTTLQAIVESGRFDDSISKRMHDSLNEISVPDLAAPYSADPSDDPARLALLESVLQAMDEQRLDALVYPTWNNPPRRIGDLQSPSGNNSFYIPPHTGQPAITVPMGFTSVGLPTGLQILGRPFAEPLLLRVAHGYEQATKHRRPPELFPKLQPAGADVN
jgi:Asp-tRNA(Asn)/Glu-tRNA(Gln) amidotransferase A subunit family amidase